MSTIIKYIILTAVRDKLFIGLFIVACLFIGVSKFLGLTALTEKQEMSLVYSAGAIRHLVIFGLILFVSIQVRRFFESKEIDIILTHPITRVKFVISYWLGTVLITALIALPIIILSVLITGVTNWSGFCLWSVSLILEGVLVSAIALFSSLILKSSVSSIIFSSCFYLLARMAVFITATASSPLVSSQPLIKWLVKPIFMGISSVMPRLDQFSQTSWLIYGGDISLYGFIFFQTVIFVSLVLTASIIDFNRKEF